MWEKFTQLTCDGCGAPDEQLTTLTVTELRKEMRHRFGWTSVDMRDYCGDCIADGSKARRVSVFDDKGESADG